MVMTLLFVSNPTLRSCDVSKLDFFSWCFETALMFRNLMKNLRLVVDCQTVRSGKLSNVGPSGSIPEAENIEKLNNFYQTS